MCSSDLPFSSSAVSLVRVMTRPSNSVSLDLSLIHILGRLAGLEILKIEEELAGLHAKIENWEAILADDARVPVSYTHLGNYEFTFENFIKARAAVDEQRVVSAGRVGRHRLRRSKRKLVGWALDDPFV